jgi:hypothetical protein
MSRRRSPPRGSESAASLYQENVNGTTYFYTQPSNGLEEDGVAPTANGGGGHSGPVSQRQESAGVVMPDYHVYPGQPAHISNMQPKANAPSFFMPDELRAALLQQHSLRLAQVDPDLHPGLFCFEHFAELQTMNWINNLHCPSISEDFEPLLFFFSCAVHFCVE